MHEVTRSVAEHGKKCEERQNGGGVKGKVENLGNKMVMKTAAKESDAATRTNFFQN